MQGAKLQAATAIDSEKEGERLRKISTDVVLLPSALVVLLLLSQLDCQLLYKKKKETL